MTLPQQKMDALLARHALVESELASGLSTEAYVKLSREFAELSPVVESIKAYRNAEKEIADLTALVDDSATDADMRNGKGYYAGWNEVQNTEVPSEKK